MAKKAPVHVTTHKDGWAVTREGNKRPSSVHRTQKEAVEAGRTAAQRDKTELIVHGKDGHIRQKNTYGTDAERPAPRIPTTTIKKAPAKKAAAKRAAR